MDIQSVNKIGKLHVEWFPQEFLDLQRELRFHPDLMTRLGEQEDKDFYIQLNEVCAHCNIVVDGTFTPNDVIELAKLCTARLYARRTGIKIIAGI